MLGYVLASKRVGANTPCAVTSSIPVGPEPKWPIVIWERSRGERSRRGVGLPRIESTRSPGPSRSREE